jgi:uncharacterized protein YjbJ (UPF0337 family)
MAAALHSDIAGRSAVECDQRRSNAISGEGVMNKDEIKGKVEKAKGYVKDKAGEVLNDPDLEAEGELEQGKGALREDYGKAKRKVSEAVDDVADSLEEDED